MSGPRTAPENAWRAAVAAVTFLTVLPLGRLVALDGKDVARGAALFPLVGAAVGALTGGLAWALGQDLPPMLAAALAVAAGAALTGALHLDGLADCADGFGARTPEDRLRVMRDHTNGTYGGTALLLDLIIRVSALAALAGTREALLFAVAAGALSRTVGPLLAVMLPYAQAGQGGKEALSSFPSQPRAAVVVVIAGLITFFCVEDGAAYPLSLCAWAVVVGLVGWTAKKRLGGVTGDVMGAASELVELAVLTVLVATL